MKSLWGLWIGGFKKGLGGLLPVSLNLSSSVLSKDSILSEAEGGEVHSGVLSVGEEAMGLNSVVGVDGVSVSLHGESKTGATAVKLASSHKGGTLSFAK